MSEDRPVRNRVENTRDLGPAGGGTNASNRVGGVVGDVAVALVSIACPWPTVAWGTARTEVR